MSMLSGKGFEIGTFARQFLVPLSVSHTCSTCSWWSRTSITLDDASSANNPLDRSVWYLRSLPCRPRRRIRLPQSWYSCTDKINTPSSNLLSSKPPFSHAGALLPLARLGLRKQTVSSQSTAPSLRSIRCRTNQLQYGHLRSTCISDKNRLALSYSGEGIKTQSRRMEWPLGFFPQPFYHTVRSDIVSNPWPASRQRDIQRGVLPTRRSVTKEGWRDTGAALARLSTRRPMVHWQPLNS